MAAHAEWQLQEAVAAYLPLALPSDAWWTSVDAAGERTSNTNALRKRRGIKAGVPDVLLLWDGKFGTIELKTPGGPNAGPGQRDEADRIIAAGGRWEQCRSVEEVELALRAWLWPLRATTLTARQRDQMLRARAERAERANAKPSKPKPKPRFARATPAQIRRVEAIRRKTMF